MSTRSASSVSLIGLGLLGSAIARRLIKQGWSVAGFDPKESARNQFDEIGGQPVSSIAQVVEGSSLIVLCLPDSSVSAQVLEELVSELSEPKSSIIVDLTTGAPEEIRSNAAFAASHQVSYFNVCVGGASNEAEEGQAILLIGGEIEQLSHCQSLLDALSEQQFHVGPAESAARMKLVTNLVLGLERLVLGEGLAFAKHLGFEPEQTLQILKAGPARSHVMWTKGEKMITEDWTPQARLDQHWKDVRLMLAEAERAELKLPLSTLHNSLLQQCHDRGWGQLDNSVVAKLLASEPHS